MWGDSGALLWECGMELESWTLQGMSWAVPRTQAPGSGLVSCRHIFSWGLTSLLCFSWQNAEPEPRSLSLGGHVGFDSLPDQLVSKSVTQGFSFNILCVGKWPDQWQKMDENSWSWSRAGVELVLYCAPCPPMGLGFGARVWGS